MNCPVKDEAINRIRSSPTNKVLTVLAFMAGMEAQEGVQKNIASMSNQQPNADQQTEVCHT